MKCCIDYGALASYANARRADVTTVRLPAAYSERCAVDWQGVDPQGTLPYGKRVAARTIGPWTDEPVNGKG